MKLIAASNKINTLSVDIALLASLTTLDLHDNALTAIPPVLHRHPTSTPPSSQYSTVIPSVLHRHPISTFNTSIQAIGALTALTVLNLGRNAITILPHDVTILVLLRTLLLDNNQLLQVLTPLKEPLHYPS